MTPREMRARYPAKFTEQDVLEAEAKMETFASGAVRSSDANETRYDLISPIAMERMARTYAEGSRKYGDNNWRKGFPFSNLLNHLERHIQLFKAGDTTEDHLAHAAWGLFCLMEFQETRPELDDRYTWPSHPEKS